MSDQIDVNQLADAINNKVDLPAGKNQSDIDYVIESKYPTSEDPTWYRLYKSGWVEQGGSITGGSVDKPVTLLKEMANTNYSYSLTYGDYIANDSYSLALKKVTATGFTVGSWYASGTNLRGPVSWEVKGISAQGGS